MAARLLTLPSLHRNALIRTGANIRYSSEGSQVLPKSRNPITRVVTFIRNDPFTRVSILFGGTVLVVLLVIESFIPKPQKRVKPQIALLPPSTTHPVVRRTSQLDTMTSWLPSFYSTGPTVATVTGPPGCGKTELVYQFARLFLDLCAPVLMTKPSKRPIVLYIDGSSCESLERSVSFCAHSLGIKTEEYNKDNGGMENVVTKLANQKAKWLLLIDNVSSDTVTIISNTLEQLSGHKYRKGTVVMTTADPTLSHTHGRSLELPQDLDVIMATNLFSRVAGIQSTDLPSIESIFNLIGRSPFNLAVAALTVRLYNHFDQAPPTSIARYVDAMGSDTPSNRPHPFTRSLKLYIDAVSSCDSNFLHALDLIGCCNVSQPIPVTLLREHLKNTFYCNSSTSVDVPFLYTSNEDVPLEPRPPTTTNYLSTIKDKLPLVGGASSQQELLQQMQQAQGNATDPLRPLFLSPFVRVSQLEGYDIQLMHIHPSLDRTLLSDNFTIETVRYLEEKELARGEEHWNRTAWFRKWRSFDSRHCLLTFLSSLPGVKEGGALTEPEYLLRQETTPLLPPYPLYLHHTSRYHIMADTLRNILRYLRNDTEDMLLKKYLSPHVDSFLQTTPTSVLDNDILSMETSLLNIRTSLSNTGFDNLFKEYNALLQAHITQYSTPNHTRVASVFTSIADIYYTHNQHLDKATQLLLQAIEVYNSVPVKSKMWEVTIDHASSLSLLGLVCASLGDKKGCVKYLEQSLMLYQQIPSDGDVTKNQRKVVATTITDLGHAYIMLGDVNAAKKYLDLAVIAQRGIHGDYHPEVVRTLNIQRVMYTLMGDNLESRTIGREAGEIQKELTMIPNIV